MDETIIEGDIDAFCVALENGSMQAQWERDKEKCQAWLEKERLQPVGLLPDELLQPCDASLD